MPDLPAKELIKKLTSMDTFSDSNWAEDPDTAESTSCSYTFLGDCLIEQTVVNQDTPAQSTCEAEYLAAGSGARDNVYVRALCKEIGFGELSGRLFTDSTNAKSATARQGPTNK